ncbi:MAG: Flp family type IVb pilin [Bacillota bacterium]
MTLLNMWLNIKGMLNNKKGQGMVEYVLIIAFIAVVVIVALTPLGTAISAKFTEIVTALTGGGGGTP